MAAAPVVLNDNVFSKSQASLTSVEKHRPVCAGHRGFKSSYPENTILGMKEAVRAGATVIETDIQVSQDNVVVICHDPTTLRCFGKFHAVNQTPYYGCLDQLTTLGQSAEPMPTFEQVARLFKSDPEFKDVQLMLDVKRNNEPSVMAKVVDVLQKVNPDMEFWATRMVLGIWREDVLLACEKVAPLLPVVHIGISKSLGLRFLKHEQVIGLSMHHLLLKFWGGAAFIDEIKRQDKLIYSWTINSVPVMQWAICSNLDGIVTDNPDVYKQLVDGISQQEMDTVYAKKPPTSFFTRKETMLLFPLLYIKARLMFLYHLFLQWWDSSSLSK